MEFLNPKIHIQQMLWEKKLREANKTSSYEISGDFFYRNKVTSDNNKVHIFTIYTKQQISHEELQKGPIAQCSIDIYRDNLAVISHISVLDDYRGQGIGRDVYERAARKARSFGGKNFYTHQESHD